MNAKIITNNRKCAESYCDTSDIDVEYDDNWTYEDVLLRARKMIHEGSQLLTHPMAGSLKPNQTPYRSVLLKSSNCKDDEYWQSLKLIESSLASYAKFINNRELPTWPQDIREDFMTIDLSHIESALDKVSFIHN